MLTTKNVKHWIYFSEIWLIVNPLQVDETKLNFTKKSKLLKFNGKGMSMRQVKPFYEYKNGFKRRYIFSVKWDCTVLPSFHFPFRFVFFRICNMLNLYFNIFSGSFWIFECIVSGFCICNYCYHHFVLQYVPLLKIFLIFYW